MGSEWEQAKLTDLYEVSSGLSKAAKYFGSGHPFLAFKDVFNNFFIPDVLSQLVESSDQEQRKCSIKRGDAFLTRTSETMDELGMSSVALKSYGSATFNGFTKRLRPKESNNLVPEYVGYYLRSSKFRQEMLAFSTMSTRASLNNEMISRLSIVFPSVNKQKAIGSILKTLDDKITLNHQINTTLESMAQALFKSWFVDFDPVIDHALAAGNPIPEELKARAETRAALGDQRKPLPDQIRQQFPDRFVMSDDLGWVPEGWCVATFGDVAEHIRKGVKVGEIKPDDFYVGLEHIEKKQFFLSSHDFGSSVESNKSHFRISDLLFGKLRPYFHKVCRAPFDGICSTDILVFRSKQTSHQSFMYMTAYRDDFVEYTNACSTGTRMPRANAKDLLNFQIVIPPENLQRSFQDMAASIWSKGDKNVREVESLTKLRDTLLPKLLSGELQVPDMGKEGLTP